MRMEMRNEKGNQLKKAGIKICVSVMTVLALTSSMNAHAAITAQPPHRLNACLALAEKNYKDCLDSVQKKCPWPNHQDFVDAMNGCYYTRLAETRNCKQFGTPSEPNVAEVE